MITTPPILIPTMATPSQSIHVTLSSQPTRIELKAKNIQIPVHAAGTIVIDPPEYDAVNLLFMDLYVSDVLIVGGALCLNGVKIKRDAYLKFIGDLAFQDTQGNADPVYTGLGKRWLLVYWPDL